MGLLRQRPLSFAAVVIVAVVAALTSTGLPSPASAATSQLWSDRATWGGDVPDAGDTVVVPSGKTIVLDVSPPKLAGVQVDGTLRFANRNLRLHTGWIMVHGRLQVGTAAAPYTRNAEIILDGDPNANIMGMGASVLGVMAGGQLELHGQPRPVRWSRLTRIAVAGSNVLHVGATKGWHAGDDIVIASTDLDPTHAEQRRVTRVDGGRVTLSAPLNHTHWGVVDDIGGRRIAQRAEVGLLSRNIVIRGGASSASTLIGGHVMVMAGSTARVSDVEFTHMGQSGRLARYPFHFHMNGSNPTSSITSSVMHHTFNRCVTVHGTSDVTVADNVGYHALGHCFFFEDGAERGVKLLRNLGVETLRPPADRRILDTDSVPASFWIQHPNNIVRGNAAAGSEGNGFWYDLPEHPTGLSATNAYSPREGAFGEFSNNVAHSNNNASGQFRSGSGLLVEDYEPPGPATFSGLTSYKNSGFGVWADGVTVANATLAENNVGFLGRGSALRDSVVVGSTSNNADKHWSMTGVGLYHDMAWVRHVTFANFKPDEWRHGVAVGPIVEDITEVPRFSAVRFVNADRVRMTPPWIEDRVAATVLEDLDGTLTGTGHPSAITASHPLLLDGGCQARASIGAHLCDPGRGITMMRVQDQTGNNAPLGPTVVRRADGAQAQIASDPGWADNPQSQGTLLMDRRYRVDLGRATPGDLEWVVSGASRGWVQLAVDWPHASAFAYEGWGEWANTLQPAGGEAGLADGDRYWLDSATGRLHVRFTNDGHLRWQRIKVCATRYCGEGLGSRTS